MTKKSKPDSIDEPVLGTGAAGDVKHPDAGAPVQLVPLDVQLVPVDVPVDPAEKSEKESDK